MQVDVNTGNYIFVQGTGSEREGAALSGSVGGFYNNANPDGRSALFQLNNASHSVEMYRGDGSVVRPPLLLLLGPRLSPARGVGT